MEIAFYILLFVLGAALGSFLCCQARRLHRHVTNQPSLGQRSVCLHCKKTLRWYENLPIISWLAQKGKCRHCHHPIGSAELIAELATAVALLCLGITFVHAPTSIIPTISPSIGSAAFGIFAPYAVFPDFTIINWATFVAITIFTLSLIFLAIYDGLYGELPLAVLIFSSICAILIVILRLWSLFSVSQFSLELVLNSLAAALLFGGLYLALYLISKGKWVGDGDWILAGAIGLALGTPFAALVALFVSNLAATLIMAPIVKHRGSHQIYFGPFLVVGYIVAMAIVL